jgi:uracil phosphoribosyltransferase
MSLHRIKDYPSVFEVRHPLVQYKLSLLRDKHTNHKLFRELVYELTLMLGYEATQNLQTVESNIETPLETVKATVLSDPNPVILPILRAGIGMVDALLQLIPSAKVGHIGLFRNEDTLQPEDYYFKVPQDSQKRFFYVCDPMLATGGSAINAVKKLKELEVSEIVFICLLAAPEGLQRFVEAHPDVSIYTASVDRCLNDKAYILPGLGDAGDRMFGTN